MEGVTASACARFSAASATTTAARFAASTSAQPSCDSPASVLSLAESCCFASPATRAAGSTSKAKW
eukprot:4860854-Prorocentrum_lima.AAC.1